MYNEDFESEEDRSYIQDDEGKWYLTPYGLACWMDDEGGLAGLMQRNGAETFIEAGCGQAIVHAYIAATEAMERELERIGAVL